MDELHASQRTIEIETTDKNHAAWLMSSDEVRFLRAEKGEGPRDRFVFADPAGAADRLVGQFVRDARMQAYTAALGRCTYLLRALREPGRSVIFAEELARPRR